MKLAPSPCRVLAAASLIALFALSARATVVFQADFNGSGSGTGGTTNIVTLGGTGAVLNVNPAYSNVDVSFSSASPLASGSSGYLSLNDKGQFQTSNLSAGVRFTPASAANSFDSWYANTSGTLGYDTLNGGFDFLFRTDSTGDLGTNTYRFFDANGGTTAYRFTLSSIATNKLSLVLTEKSTAIRATSSTVSLAANTTYRIAGTVSTNSDGLATVNLYLAAGDTAIDTSSTTHRIATATSASALDADNSITSSFSSAAGINFGLIQNSTTDTKTFDLDAFRLYNSVPATFSSIPEPGSLTLVMGALAGVGACVARRRR